MPSFTLIHGSTQNNTAWADVAERLRSDGHVVSMPDLPKSEPFSSVSLCLRGPYVDTFLDSVTVKTTVSSRIFA